MPFDDGDGAMRGGQSIGAGHTCYGDHIVRYIYSGNEKIAMVWPKDINNLSAGEEILTGVGVSLFPAEKYGIMSSTIFMKGGVL